MLFYHIINEINRSTFSTIVEIIIYKNEIALPFGVFISFITKSVHFFFKLVTTSLAHKYSMTCSSATLTTALQYTIFLYLVTVIDFLLKIDGQYKLWLDISLSFKLRRIIAIFERCLNDD